MAQPNSRSKFKEYCMRRLGYPVIPIALDDDQIEDRIDDAISFFQDYHYDALIRTYLKHQLTADDIANGYIQIPDHIIGVIDLLGAPTAISSADSLFDVNYQIALNDLFSLTSVSLVPYMLAQQHLSLIQQMFSKSYLMPFRYQRHDNKLYLDTDKALLVCGNWIVAEVYQTIDPANYTDVWKDRWLLQYATALLKRQWGEHLKLFNITLVGGVQYNGQQIWNEANDEVLRLEEMLINDMSGMLQHFIG